MIFGDGDSPPRAPADHDGPVCARCRYAARPRLDPHNPFGWRCSAHPERRVRKAWKDPVTGIATPEEWEPAWCEHHNSRGECELYEVGEPRERSCTGPLTTRPPDDQPPPPPEPRTRGAGPDEPNSEPGLPLPLLVLLAIVVSAALTALVLATFGPGNATPPAEVDQP